MKKAVPYFIWLAVVYALVAFLPIYTNAQTQIVEVEYFLDVDPGPGNATAVAFAPDDSVDLTFNVSVAGLPAGFHFLVVRAKDSDGNWSIINSSQIFVNPLSSPIIPPLPPFTLVQGEYFYDSDPGPGNGFPISMIPGDTLDITRAFSVSGLDIGAHKVGVRFRELTGLWGIAQWRAFNVVDTSMGQPVADFICVPGNAGNPTTFTNTSLNTGPLTVYQWDIDGDGTVDYTTPNVNHVYATPGIYDVTLTVYNPGLPVSTIGIKALSTLR